MTQEEWIEEALRRRPDRIAEALSHLDLDALHEYNLRRLATSPAAGGPSRAIRDRVPIRQDRPAKHRETS